jgi:hypothetical protein
MLENPMSKPLTSDQQREKDFKDQLRKRTEEKKGERTLSRSLDLQREQRHGLSNSEKKAGLSLKDQVQEQVAAEYARKKEREEEEKARHIEELRTEIHQNGNERGDVSATTEELTKEPNPIDDFLERRGKKKSRASMLAEQVNDEYEEFNRKREEKKIEETREQIKNRIAEAEDARIDV